MGAINQDLIFQASSDVSFAASNTIERPLSTMILLLIIAVSWFLLSSNSLRQCLLSDLWAVALHLPGCQQQDVLSSSLVSFVPLSTPLITHSKVFSYPDTEVLEFISVLLLFSPGSFSVGPVNVVGRQKNFIRRDQNCSTIQCLCSRKDVVVVRQKCAVAGVGQGWDKWTPCVLCPAKPVACPVTQRTHF